jgi:serine/threonine-protein kinase
VAFAMMFIVDILSGPPGSSSTGPANPSAAPATASASSSAPQPTDTTVASPSPSASKSTEDRKFPEKIVYAGHAKDGAGAIAVAVLGTQAAAYFCDGRRVESWFRGSVPGSDISLKSKDGAILQASLDGDHLKGSLRIKSDRIRFEVNMAKKPAGLYRARGSKTTIGWIVLEDGSEVGVQTTGKDSTPAPDLNPENPQVTVDGEKLDAAPINGNEDL